MTKINIILLFLILSTLSVRAKGESGMVTAEQVIKKLGLEPLPGEGGYFVQTHKDRQQITLPDHPNNPRSASTAIYYLVTPESFSALHRLTQDEVFHFYGGDPVEMIQMTAEGKVTHYILGSDFMNDQRVQVVVPKGVWQGLKLIEGGKWALLGTTVAPGFEFADFELATKEKLMLNYPDHCKNILNFIQE